MFYNLTIISTRSGDRNTARIKAEGYVGAGLLKLTYNFDGAEYAITASRVQMMQERRGDVTLKMCFKRECRTTCSLGDERNMGTFEIYCSDYRAAFVDGTCKIFCVFNTIGDPQTFLEITAEKMQ